MIHLFRLLFDPTYHPHAINSHLAAVVARFDRQHVEILREVIR